MIENGTRGTDRITELTVGSAAVYSAVRTSHLLAAVHRGTSGGTVYLRLSGELRMPPRGRCPRARPPSGTSAESRLSSRDRSMLRFAVLAFTLAAGVLPSGPIG